VSDLRRVVFDTSTLASAALRVGSLPHRALAHALTVGEVCASASTLTELDEVLMRPKFDNYQPVEVRREFAAVLRQSASLFVVSEADISNVVPPCRDSKENQFLALILACDADALVSSDADLLVLHPWNGVPILTPAAFMKKVSA